MAELLENQKQKLWLNKGYKKRGNLLGKTSHLMMRDFEQTLWENKLYFIASNAMGTCK